MIRAHTEINHKRRDKKLNSVSGRAYCRHYADNTRFGPRVDYEVGECWANAGRILRTAERERNMIRAHTKINHRLRSRKLNSISGRAYCRRYLADMYVGDTRFSLVVAYEVGEYYARLRKLLRTAERET